MQFFNIKQQQITHLAQTFLLTRLKRYRKLNFLNSDAFKRRNNDSGCIIFNSSKLFVMHCILNKVDMH
jgi:hypothetical protein